MSEAYAVSDEIFLWWLAEPGRPRLVGTLRTARAMRGVSLRYAPEWLATGRALSEDLPLVDEEFLPRERDSAPGAVNDARPDRWGERVIRMLDKPPRLSLLEFLYFAGDERFGALGVSTSATDHRPRRVGPMPTLPDTDAIHDLVRRVLEGEAIPPGQARLLSPGVSMGGARPKALIEIDGAPWVVKFAEAGDPLDTPLIEHATMTLARKARIASADTRAIRLTHGQGHAVAIRRFDRERAADGTSRRVHALSAHVALGAAGEASDYPALAQLLRRRGPADAYAASMHELFRRMVFNILVDNTDDHDQNHVLLARDEGALELAPAFDVLPSGQALGYQQMRVGTAEADSTIDNALSQAAQFGLTHDKATAQVGEVATVVATWRAHFEACGVGRRDLESLSEQIDRPFLRDQRDAWAAKAGQRRVRRAPSTAQGRAKTIKR